MKINKQIFSWALFDFGNSAFATTIMAGLFPVFFKEYWSFGYDFSLTTQRLGFGNSLAGIIVALLAPILGAIADKGSKVKGFLIFFTSIGVLATIFLATIGKGNYLGAISLYILGVVGFSGGNIFYDSLLTVVAKKEEYDFVSLLGYSLGYLGGGILFLLNVLMILFPSFFGIETAELATKISFVSVGLWWFIFALPLFFFVKEKQSQFSGNMVIEGYKELLKTFKKIKKYKAIMIFLFAYFFYIDGVNTIIRMAVDYGLSIGLSANSLITALIITQFVGFPASLLYYKIDRKIGVKRGIYLAICIYIFISIWGFLISSEIEFYLVSAIIGLVQGAIQALSRSYFAGMIPKNHATEFFGFYNMVGKFSTVLGPSLMSIFILLAISLGASAMIASRISILAINILLVSGVVLLGRVEQVE